MTSDRGRRGVWAGTIVRAVVLVVLLAVVVPALIANADTLAVPVVALVGLGMIAAAVWAELEPKAVFTMEHLFEFYGDDAGWSFEARGVEPEISKVQ